MSNDQQILKAVTTLEVSLTLLNLDFKDILTERTLQISKNPSTDVLQIKVTTKGVSLTKRGILSYTN